VPKPDYTVKPRIWGPLSAVQSNVKHQCDAMGLPHFGTYLAMWEYAGTIVHDYGLKESGYWSFNPSNLPSWGSCLDGTGVVFDNTQNTVPPLLPNSGNDSYWRDAIPAITVGLRTSFDGDTGGPIGIWGIGGVANGLSLSYKTSPNTFSFEIEPNNESVDTNTTYTPSGQILDIVCVFNGSSMAIYINGQLDSSLEPVADAPDSNAVDPEVGLADSQTASGDEWGGVMTQWWTVRQGLTADQVALLHEQPYRMLYPAKRTFYSLPPETPSGGKGGSQLITISQLWPLMPLVGAVRNPKLTKREWLNPWNWLKK